ncbi:MAG: DUF4870 domain-containing protein [Flavobacteriales bacterium]|jgi:uncharacterized membrane protein|nr:DUF4870 domain-containing protein [Flavobacteriales bacterium]NCG29404.1 DUF4870 domain-containing protein [Bacteroidota bacterium]MBT4705524.1 DUF4870 domain-containing protein [Flavobacteriales bacterium]MBT4930815.1 DUF4870 domain-containing protein [Flavobacteriales bacterium]MBT5132148.1 DUF4870 domain-containing protein [Flavobacteriales bacterium]
MVEEEGIKAEKYHPLPQPDEISEREREDAMGAYLMMFAAVAVALPLPIINLIAAVIYFYINRRKSRFIHFHTLQSLLSQLPTTFLNWGLLYWSIHIWLLNHGVADDVFYGYLIMVIVANILYFIFSLLAAVRARKGRMYYFVFFGKFSFEQVFSKARHFDYEGEKTVEPANLSPYQN